MFEFIQYTLNGITMGIIYALIAVGFVLIYKSSKILNFAVGEFVAIGSLILWTLKVNLGMPFWGALLLGIVLMALIGVLIERVLLRPLIGQPILSAIVMTIGLAYVLRGIALAVWGGAPKNFGDVFPGQSIEIITDLTVSQTQLWSFGICLAIFVIMHYFFKKTTTGLNLRATAEGHEVAQSIGVKVNNAFIISWVGAGVLSLMAGLFLATMSSASTGLADLGLKVLPVVLLGGLESFIGAIAAALIIGVCESLVAGYIDALVGGGTSEIFAFAVMIIILMVRPYGLFGLKKIERI